MRLAEETKLNSLEKPKQITLHQEAWTVENGILTPTMKVKRNVVKKMWEADINAMYAGKPMSKK